MKKLLTILTLCLALGWYVLYTTPSAQAADSAINSSEVTNDTLNRLNPLSIGLIENSDINSDQKGDLFTQLSTPGGIISRALLFAFPLAGLILFIMIVWGGFEMLMDATSKKSIDAGRERIKAALIGFVLLFVSYWIMRVIEGVFGIRIVSFT